MLRGKNWLVMKVCPLLHPCKEGAAILPGENGSRATRPPLRTNSTQLIGYRVRSRDVGTTLKSRQFPSAAFHKGPFPYLTGPAVSHVELSRL